MNFCENLVDEFFSLTSTGVQSQNLKKMRNSWNYGTNDIEILHFVLTQNMSSIESPLILKFGKIQSKIKLHFGKTHLKKLYDAHDEIAKIHFTLHHTEVRQNEIS